MRMIHLCAALVSVSTVLPLAAAAEKQKLKEWVDVLPTESVVSMTLPGLNMQPFATRRMLINRRGFVYHHASYAQNGEKYPTAQFYMQDLGDADQTFIVQHGEDDSVATRVKEVVNDLESVGTADSASNDYGSINYVHYVSKGQGPCLYFRQYGGSDGAGDVTTGGEPIGSKILEGHLCLGSGESGPVDAKLEKIFLSSFKADLD